MMSFLRKDSPSNVLSVVNSKVLERTNFEKKKEMINETETGLSHFLQKISVTFKLQRVGTMNVLVMQDKKKMSYGYLEFKDSRFSEICKR